MADIGRLGQAGRAGGVNQEGAVGDRYRSPLQGAQCVAGERGDHVIDAFERAVTAMSPDCRMGLQAWLEGLQFLRKLGRGNKMFRRYGIDAMGE